MPRDAPDMHGDAAGSDLPHRGRGSGDMALFWHTSPPPIEVVSG